MGKLFVSAIKKVFLKKSMALPNIWEQWIYKYTKHNAKLLTTILERLVLCFIILISRVCTSEITVSFNCSNSNLNLSFKNWLAKYTDDWSLSFYKTIKQTPNEFIFLENSINCFYFYLNALLPYVLKSLWFVNSRTKFRKLYTAMLMSIYNIIMTESNYWLLNSQI